MFKNYLILAFRNVARQKALSFINISGLAVGMACCFHVLMFVLHEFSYDNFHKNSTAICNGDAISAPPLFPCRVDGKSIRVNTTGIPRVCIIAGDSENIGAEYRDE